VTRIGWLSFAIRFSGPGSMIMNLLTICLLLLDGCTAAEASAASPRLLDHRLTYCTGGIRVSRVCSDPNHHDQDQTVCLW
jgi:hypothetical protein